MPTTRLFAEGWVGVEIFFVISGFVIAYSTEGATPGRFARHRIQRLLPAALICASITATVRFLNGQPAVSIFPLWWRSIIFFPSGPWIDGAYWTLPIEIAFYLLVLAALFWKKGKHLPKMMAALGTASTLSSFVLLTSPRWVNSGVLQWIASCWFPPNACFLIGYGSFFALGVLLYSALQHGLTWEHVFLPVGALGCVAEICWHEKGAAINTHRAVNYTCPVAIWLLSVTFLVFSVLQNTRLKEWLGGRGVALSRLVGLVTYPLYLVHAEIGEWLMHGLTHRIGYAASMLFVSSAMITIAVLIAVYAEPLVRSLISPSRV